MNRLLEGLNEPQKEAVVNSDGPVIVIAGAGSGKTRVLTMRIAYLMHNGVSPFNILALTFTNKAAKEMKERIENIIGPQARNLWMGTFHSVFSRILRAESEKLGFPSNFTIYDTDDAKNLLKAIINELKLDDKIYKPSSVYGRISGAKNNLISSQDYNANPEISKEDRMANRPMVGQIYSIYQKRLVQSSAMDFDDLLFNTNILFVKYPDVLNKYQDKFRFILVDEYQDTNYAQYIIVKKLAAKFENICVVGDDAQSIYAFRGANIQNILNFQKDYPDFKSYKLEQNYRSTKNIVHAANSIIKHNTEQLKKDVWTDNPEGEKIIVQQALTDNDEGKIVAENIYDTKMQNFAKNKDFAILYRTNAQSRSFEEALRKSGINYKIYGGLSFYQRKEIKDLVAYFRMVINPNDEEALKRIINYPVRGIGNTTVDKLIVTASENEKGIWFILENLMMFPMDLNKGAYQKLSDFVTLIKSFQVMNQSQGAYEVAEYIARHTGIVGELFNDKTPQGVSRYENVQELLNGIKEFSEEVLPDENGELPVRKLFEYIQDIALLTDRDKETDDEASKDTVTLMTIHAAKGLEFPYVYIVGLEEDLFPSKMSTFASTDLEEERRLFYVALTRAEKKAMLTYADSRFQWGKLVNNKPSRFISELDQKHLDIKVPLTKGNSWYNSKDSDFAFDDDKYEKSAAPKQNYSSQKSASQATPAKPSFSAPKNLTKVTNTVVNAKAATQEFTGDDPKNIKEGAKVEHNRFGIGIVKKLEGNYPNIKATVNFEGAGDKQLLLQFAKLKILN